MSNYASPPAGNSSLRSFAVEPYKPDGGFQIGGVMMLVGALAVVGAILGAVAHFVSKGLWLILVFPALIGFALGAIGALMVKSGHVRNPLIGGTAGFLGGILAMGVMHYMDYQDHMADLAKPDRQEAVNEVRAGTLTEENITLDGKTLSPHDAHMAIEYLKVDSFLSYMNFAADEGVEIKGTHDTSTSSGLNLGFVGTWIYWIIEVAIVAFITLGFVVKNCRAPYCLKSGEWKRSEPLGSFSGDYKFAKDGVTSGNLAEIAAAVPATTGGAVLTMHVSPNHPESEPLDLELTALVKDKNGKLQRRRVAIARWPAEAASALRAVMKPTPIGAPPPLPAV